MHEERTASSCGLALKCQGFCERKTRMYALTLVSTKVFANASPDAPNIPRILLMRGLFGASHAVAASYVWSDILNMSWVTPEHALVLTWHRRI